MQESREELKEDLKKTLDKLKKICKDTEEITKLKADIAKEKARLRELNPTWWDQLKSNFNKKEEYLK